MSIVKPFNVIVTPDYEDATAVPGDVMAGKIFYNNEGRQEGTRIPDLASITKSYTFLNTATETQDLGSLSTRICKVNKLGQVLLATNTLSSSTTPYSESALININILLAVEYDSYRFNVGVAPSIIIKSSNSTIDYKQISIFNTESASVDQGGYYINLLLNAETNMWYLLYAKEKNKPITLYYV